MFEASRVLRSSTCIEEDAISCNPLCLRAEAAADRPLRGDDGGGIFWATRALLAAFLRIQAWRATRSTSRTLRTARTHGAAAATASTGRRAAQARASAEYY